MGSQPAPKTIVLIVEDEPILRMMAIDLVEDAGFEALEASNADEAVRVLEGRDDIRIVFSDIDMPGSMNGLKLASAIRGRWPPIKIILTSGHYDVRPYELPTQSVFIPKPYAWGNVVDVLERFAAAV